MYVAPFIAHRYLHDRVGILHCDLSINNVLLIRKDDKSKATGLLIDYGYSIDVDLEAAKHTAAHTSGHNTCTAEDTPTGERLLTVANADSEVPLDVSEESVAVQVRAEKAQGRIPRTVRCAHLLHC